MSEDKKIINDNEEINNKGVLDVSTEEAVEDNEGESELVEENKSENEEIVKNEVVEEKTAKTKLKKIKNTKSIIAMAIVGCICLGAGFTYGKSVGRTLPATSRKYSSSKIVATVGDTKFTGEQLRQKMDPL